ncbi:extracellular solute-binding protein [bacterium]|nr:extracellular solute-binding protein [bacterium]
MRPRLSFVLFCLLTAWLMTGCDHSEREPKRSPTATPPANPNELRIYMDPIGRAGLLNRMMVQEFSEQFGIPVQIISNVDDATDRLDKITQILASRTSGIDILMIDFTWAPMLHQYTEDLAPRLGREKDEFFPQLIRQNTAQGKLVGIPMYVDTGILYYRADLMEKYGYSEPPVTWEEMAAMAAHVQEEERKRGNLEFWGLALAANAQENLTCMALEWQASAGGGTMVTDGGRVTVNNRGTVEALTMARGWIGKIAPEQSLSMDNEAARRQFQEGNALFMRGWSYAWELLNDDTSAVRGKVKIALLPGGVGGRRSVLGGWQLAISASSTRKDNAWKLVQHLTSARSQRLRAMEGGFPPTRPKLYEDPNLQRKQPHLPLIGSAIGSSVMRPSRGARNLYGQVSMIYFTGVSDVLAGRSNPEVGLDVMEAKMKRALER